MTQRRKLPRFVTDGLTGWVGGAGGAIVFGLAWPVAFPAFVRPEHYYGYGPTLIQVIFVSIIVASPAAFVGGVIGGRASIEGGAGAQRMISIIFGIILSLPFTCYMFWVFTGF